MTTELSGAHDTVPTARPNIGIVLQVGPLMPSVQDAITTEFDALRLPDDDTRAEFIAEHADDITVAVTSGKVGVDGALMTALPRLAAVINFGVGYDTTDADQAKARGIAISNTPDVLNDCVADTAVSLLLDSFRRTTEADRFVRRGDWLNANFPLAARATGKRIGIVGLGRIGRAIATRLEGFRMVVSYHNRSPVSDVGYTYQDSLLALAEDSDALIVAAAGGPDSHELISAEVLEALGPQGYLVNIARGSVVDQDALVRALVSGQLAGAGLDVYADEPRIPAELLELENVVLLPHLASGTVETRRDMADLTLANLRTFLADGTLVTPVF